MRWCLVFLLQASVVGGGESSSPNVLLIAVDDLNDWVGCLQGHPQALTPSIDQLARRGILFTNAHCVSPACNPSRAAVFSGLLPWKTGVWSNYSPRLLRQHPDIQDLSRSFQKAGYATFGTGKLMHSGAAANRVMFQQHFDVEQRWSPFTREMVRYSNEELPSKCTDNPRHIVRLADSETIVLPLNRMSSDRNPSTPDGESFDWGPLPIADAAMGDTQITTWAIRQLERKHEQPFFLAVGYYRPHIPLWAPADYFQRFSGVPIQLPPYRVDDLDDLSPTGRRWAIEPVTAGLHETVIAHGQWEEAVKAYLACTTYVDKQIGRLLESLDESPHRDNTMIVLWSDHGWHLGEKQHWGKWTGWERSTRVPLIVAPTRRSAAEMKTAGRRCDQPVSLLDLYPTLTDLCDIAAPDSLDGKSLKAHLFDPDQESGRIILTLFDPGNIALRSSRWRYIQYADGSEELYDLKSDPNEWDNLATDTQHAGGAGILPTTDPARGPWPTRGTSNRDPSRPGARALNPRILSLTLWLSLLTPSAHVTSAHEAGAEAPNTAERTPVEHVTTKPRLPGRGLGTVDYRPSDQERPYFDKLDVTEMTTGGLSGEYRLSGREGLYVGWFGIVRKTSEDEGAGQTSLVVEHKYFDGLTDSHIQALSFNGAGDFVATLHGTDHRIPALSLVKVYGKVSEEQDAGRPEINAVFVRTWHWGTFTFLAPHGIQHGSEGWRTLNQVDLDKIYEPYPNDTYYVERLGKRPETAERNELLERLAEEAANDFGIDPVTLFGADALPTPTSSLERTRIDSPSLRTRAQRTAVALHADSNSIVDPIVDALLKEDRSAIYDAMKAAEQRRMETSAVAVLTEALQHKDETVRMLAAETLDEIGFPARISTSALISALRDECMYVRNYAASALGNIGPEARAATPALLISLRDQSSSVRWSACEALGQIDASAKYVVPAMIKMVQDTDSQVRWQAVGVLRQYGEAAAAATPVLRASLLQDSDSSVRWNSAEALAAVNPDGDVSIPALMTATEDKDPSVRRFAARGLGSLGTTAGPATRRLREMLDDRDVGVRIAAAGALWKVNGNTEATLPVLTQVLEQEKGIACVWAAGEIAQMGPDAQDAIPALCQMMVDAPRGWRPYALRRPGPYRSESCGRRTGFKQAADRLRPRNPIVRGPYVVEDQSRSAQSQH